MRGLLFVAETDEAGSVQWVWVATADGRRVRPARPGTDHFGNLSKARFYGARAEDIRGWLNRHTLRSET
jgi:hypothetical protein